MSVRFGLFVPQGWRMDLVEIADPVAQYEAMTEVARRADRGPWDSVWTFDHFHTVPTTSAETTFESWVVTATLARDTQRVRIGQMVTSNGYRNPALLAKMASTADVASAGRIIAGLGAGWHEEEWQAYGYDWTPLRNRMRSFAESVEIVQRMWTEDRVVFRGEHHSVISPVNAPRGARSRPQLWLGGGGERVTLRLVAQFADGCNVGSGRPEVIRQKLHSLRGHCETLGRDYDSISRSTSINLFPVPRGADVARATARARGRFSLDEFRRNGVGGSADGIELMIASPAQIAQRVQDCVDAGANYVIFYVPGVAYDPDSLELLAAEVLSQFSY